MSVETLPSWFDLKKYEKLNNTSNINFAYNLLLRKIILDGLSKNTNDMQSELSRLISEVKEFAVIEDFHECIYEYFFDKHLRSSNIGEVTSVGLGVVCTLPIVTAYEIYEAVKHDTLLRGNLAFYEYNQNIDSSSYESWYENVFLKQSIKDLENTCHYDYFSNVVLVDLNASDEKIIAGFQDWLSAARADLLFPADSFGIEKHFVDIASVRDRLMKAAIFPYLDLKIHCLMENVNYTNNILGQNIFPDVFDVDTTESVRKTTRPLAEKALSMAYRCFRKEIEKEISKDPF